MSRNGNTVLVLAGRGGERADVTTRKKKPVQETIVQRAEETLRVLYSYDRYVVKLCELADFANAERLG